MLPERLRNRYYEVGALLSCNRARLDASRGIRELENMLAQDRLLLSNWRVQYIGVCALLRAAIHLLSVDSKSCHNQAVANELRSEWNNIAENRDAHKIYWEFINKERNAILKEYHWSAYEAYLDKDGKTISPTVDSSVAGLLLVSDRSELRIRGGAYQDEDVLSVLSEAENWILERITAALERANFSLDEKVHFTNWAREPETKGTGGILGGQT